MFVCAKLPAFGPVMVMPVTARAAVPVFDSVMVCAVLVVVTT